MVISLAEFADRMAEIMPVIVKEFGRHQENELCKGTITVPQLLLLNYLDMSGESKMKDLAGYMGVTTAAMTGIVDRLVREDYAQRLYDKKDRRIIRIKLTTTGFALVRKVGQQKKNMVIKIFGKVSQHDREEYLRIVTKIRDVLIIKE